MSKPIYTCGPLKPGKAVLCFESIVLPGDSEPTKLEYYQSALYLAESSLVDQKSVSSFMQMPIPISKRFPMGGSFTVKIEGVEKTIEVYSRLTNKIICTATNAHETGDTSPVSVTFDTLIQYSQRR
jgi:hypothetical protein